MKQNLVGCIAIAALALSSCTKDVNEVTPPPPTNPDKSVAVTKESVSGKYVVTAITLGDGGLVERDITTEVMPDECQRDDSYDLQLDGTLTYTDEGNQCTNTRPLTTGTWDLVTASEITIDGETHTIKSFNGKDLITQDQRNYNGDMRTITTFYQKQ